MHLPQYLNEQKVQLSLSAKSFQSALLVATLWKVDNTPEPIVVKYYKRQVAGDLA